jgi:hypothetical protein
LALWAHAFEVNREVDDLKAGAMWVGQEDAAEFGMVEVNYLIASNADQMVMMIGVAVESGGGFEVMGSLGDTQFD